MSKRALIIGATSSVAQSLCRVLASRGYALMLAGRDEQELLLLAADLSSRFAIECQTFSADMLSPEFSGAPLIEQAGELDDVVIALGDMGSKEQDTFANIQFTAHINYILPAQLAALAAEKLSLQKHGTVTIISSVAGDRGRQSNFAYGSAKAALSTFASGLRNYYAKKGVHVMTVKPGFIDTPMTWGMKSPLIASREYVATKIADAMEKKKDVIYVPFFWRFIMLIIMHIPERIFKKLSL